jgi:VWFA-related protein
MHVPRRLLLVVAATLTFGMVPAAQQRPSPQQPQPSPQPTQQQGQPPATPERVPGQEPIRSGINFVRVDVIVTDRQGNPVLDLTQDEFQVAEDGKPQAIQTFSVVKVEDTRAETQPSQIRSMSDEEREAARPDVRLFVILLDDYHVRRGNDMAVRKPLIEFIQNQLSPVDMVAVMYPLTPVNDIQFSRNRASLISAIESFEGRKHDYRPRNMFEEQYAMYPAQTVERIRNQVTMSALKAASVRLSGLREGRKSIIFVSEGFTALLPAQLSDPIASLPGVGNPNRGNPMAPQATDRQNFLANTDLLSEMQDVFRVLNRENTSIYAVDPRGLAAFAYDINQAVGPETDRQALRESIDSLQILASNTDGRAIINRNDLSVGMKQIIRDSSGYYLLGYTSAAAPTDGKFHQIKVSVKRKGVDVRARKGYWALTEEDAARATAAATHVEPPKELTEALSVLAEPPRGRPARFWVGTGRAASGATRLTFVWEPVPGAPGEPPAAAAARVSLTALAADGRPLFRGRIPDGPAAAAADAGAPGAAKPAAGGAASFEVPPGPVQLRISVEGARGEVLDSASREMNVPDFTSVQVALGTPRFYRARTVRELQALKTNADAVPTADRDFNRTERVIARVDAYAPGGLQPAIAARLLNRNGDAVTDVPVQVAGTAAMIELTLANLAPAEYLLELTAKTEAGSARELLAFKVSR